jgi:phospholipase C
MKTFSNNGVRSLLSGVLCLGLILAIGTTKSADLSTDHTPLRDLNQIKYIIIIYQENWSFDALYGQFPGANGYANSFDTLPQLDVKASPPYSFLIYQTPSPLTGSPLVPDPQFPSVDGKLALASNRAFPSNPPLPLQLIPYDLTKYIKPDAFTGDLVHRFYHQQLQIDNGVLEEKNGDLGKFVTWSDNPGLVLSYFDATDLPEGRLAQEFLLCDNFFHSAYGGSFLNQMWLVAAATPPWTAPIPDGFLSSYDAVAKILKDNQLTFDGKYVVNTVQPLLAPFSPNPLPDGTPTAERLLINNTDPNEPGYTPNIGNRLDDAGIDWRWYAGGWNEALANNVTANSNLFQFHHQPFAYFTKYAPFKEAPTKNYSASNPPELNPETTGPRAHLQDEQQFFLDVASGKLPPVSFIKPIGANNEHPGYANLVKGQQHVAGLVAAVQKSRIWEDCVIIITYDENGGRWDHVVPPVRKDGWGVGTRVPTIIVSPFVQRGRIDNTEYETVSILKLIERRFGLKPLSARDNDPKINDLTHALGFSGKPAKTGKRHTLTVIHGTGTGQYAPSASVRITASAPTANQRFAGWSGDTVILDNSFSPNATVTMPSMDVTVAATYVDK